MEVKSLGQLVQESISNDTNGVTTLSKFVSQNMRDDINRTEAYYNSQFTSGSTDADGRPKPFMNICYPATNIWYRATDIDSKDLRIRAKNEKQVVSAFLATILLQQWMNSENFGQFLNEWGHVLAKHGSAVVEIVEKEGKLNCRVLDWNNIIVDPIDFDSNIKIKRLWLTPAQLKKNKSYDQEMVKDLLETLEARETSEGKQKDNKANFIEVFEVHGELPLSYLSGKEKDEEYVQQMHVITFNAKKNKANEYDEYCLYSGREKKDPLMLTQLIKIESQTYVGGAVKNLFEAQWMTNDTEKMMRDQLLIGSKIIFQGSDSAMDGANFFSGVDNGEYLLHKPNEPMTRVAGSPDIAAIQNYQAGWKQHANSVNGIADAMVSQAKSGTAWRQTQAELQEAHSLFELMTETKGLYLKQIFNDYVLDYFKKQLDNDEPISKILESHEIKQIDDRYLPAETTRRMNQKKKDIILSGEIYDPAMEQQDVAEMGQQVESELTGNQRFVKPSKESWKEEFEDLDWELELDITGESENVQEKMASLNTALTFLVNKQGQPLTQEESVVFQELLLASGSITPLKLSTFSSKPVVSQPIPQEVSKVAPSMVK